MLENEVRFGFCGEIDHCGVYKLPDAVFWKGDHVKSGS